MKEKPEELIEYLSQLYRNEKPFYWLIGIDEQFVSIKNIIEKQIEVVPKIRHINRGTDCRDGIEIESNCPDCGREVSDAMSYCPRCGKKQGWSFIENVREMIKNEGS